MNIKQARWVIGVLITVGIIGFGATLMINRLGNTPTPQKGCYSTISIAFLQEPADWSGNTWHYHAPTDVLGVKKEMKQAAHCFVDDTSVPLSQQDIEWMKKASDAGYSGIKWQYPPEVLTPHQIAEVSKLDSLSSLSCLTSQDQKILNDIIPIVDHEYHNHDMSRKFGSYDFRLTAKDVGDNRAITSFVNILRDPGIPLCPT